MGRVKELTIRARFGDWPRRRLHTTTAASPLVPQSAVAAQSRGRRTAGVRSSASPLPASETDPDTRPRGPAGVSGGGVSARGLRHRKLGLRSSNGGAASSCDCSSSIASCWNRVRSPEGEIVWHAELRTTLLGDGATSALSLWAHSGGPNISSSGPAMPSSSQAFADNL